MTSLPLDDPEPRLDPGQPVPIGRDALGQLGPAQPQHAAQLARVDLVVEDQAHLVRA